MLFSIPSDPDSVIRHRRDALISTLKFVDFKMLTGKIEDRTWRSFIGMSREDLMEVHARFVPDLPLRTLMMALHFLKVYPTEDVGALTFKVTRNTWRVNVNSGLLALNSCLPKVFLINYVFMCVKLLQR